MKPYEIVAQPFTLWIAPVGTAFPQIDTAPAVAWIKVGVSGELNYAEHGVTVDHKQSHVAWHAAGSTGPRKAFRTEEELHIKMSLADLTLEAYQLALNYNVITVTSQGTGIPGSKKIGLERGLSFLQRALLVRSAISPYSGSPYGDGFAMQYEVPIAVQIAEAQVVFVKNAPALLALEWLALEDPNAISVDERFGRLVCQTSVAL
jgi:hypothetical protein